MAKQTVHYKSDKKQILVITDSDSGDFYLYHLSKFNAYYLTLTLWYYIY